MQLHSGLSAPLMQTPVLLFFKPRYKCYTNRLTKGQHEKIELLELKTQEERLKNYCGPTSVPDNKMTEFNTLQDVERVELHLKPIFSKEKKK